MIKTFKEKKFKTIVFFIMILLKALFLAFSSISSVFSFDYLFQQNFQMFLIWIFIDFISALGFWLLVLYNNYLINQLSETYINLYKKDLINAISNKKISKIKEKSNGYYLSIFNDDIELIRENIFINKMLIFDYLLSFAALFIVLIYFSYILIIVICLIMIILKVFTIFLEKWNTKTINRFSEIKNTFLDKLLNFINGFSKFVFQNKTKIFVSLILKEKKLMAKEAIKFQYKSDIANTLINSFTSISQFLIFLIVGILFYNDLVKVGIFLVIVGISTEFINLVDGINTSFLKIRSTKDIKEKVQKLFVSEPQKDEVQISGINTIEVKKLNFSYGKKTIFKNLNLKFDKNKKYLIIAKNGKGKSTLIKIILGLLSTEEESVFINDQSLEKIDLQNLKKYINFIDNNPYIFNDLNIEENIFFDDEFAQSKLDFVIKEALIDFDDVKNLSSGQKQRLNLARIFANPKDIIILDEALSNIDKKRRFEIENNLLKLNSTLINITHHYDEEIKSKYDFVIEL